YGFETPDTKEQRFIESAKNQGYFSGSVETRQRKSRKTELNQGRANRGFVCNRCREMLQSESRDDSVVEFESKVQGFEQPGSNLYTFRVKQDLESHIRLVHLGKPWADKHIRGLGDSK